jgi:hypothetical protein
VGVAQVQGEPAVVRLRPARPAEHLAAAIDAYDPGDGCPSWRTELQQGATRTIAPDGDHCRSDSDAVATKPSLVFMPVAPIVVVGSLAPVLELGSGHAGQPTVVLGLGVRLATGDDPPATRLDLLHQF